jgi:L-rhamnose-H+ transport protein
MVIISGLLLIAIAGFFQGTFVLPMTLTRKWAWEHTWAAFSLFGMLLFNWLIGLLVFPNVTHLYRAVPSPVIFQLALLGAGWGVGAILFGMGMDKLGLALGYPIIMGLIASLGATVPLVVFLPGELLTARGLVLGAGMAMVFLGIVLCSVGGARKQSASSAPRTGRRALTAGLAIAIFAGVLSCLPNVGMAFATSKIEASNALGPSPESATNAVWSLFFTVGFLVNFAYCLFLMLRKKNISDYQGLETGRNLRLAALMGIMWIASFYLYGMGAAKLGRWGSVVGWPIFISLSIVVGNAWGIWRGEWAGAPSCATRFLSRGIAVLVLAVVVIAGSNLL